MLLRTVAAFFVALALSGCAGIQRGEGLGNPDTFAKCAGADIGTTAATLAMTHRVELNPIVNALSIKALGHVGSIIVPAIGLSIAVYYALRWADSPALTATASALSCASAARNLYVINH